MTAPSRASDGARPFRASVIIVNYQGRGRLGPCLDALFAAAAAFPFEVIVVDNASSDGSAGEAGGHPVTLVRNDHNAGFGAACNQGAAIAQGDNLVFLNFDCLARPGWLDALVACAESAPDAGAVQGVVIRPDGTVNTAGNKVHYLGFSWAPAAAAPPTGAAFETAAGSGACLLVPRDRFFEVGGFWEAMFLYCEDTDLSWRLRLAGWRVLVCPGAEVVHDYDFGRNPGKYFQLERTRLLMLAANYDIRTLLRLGPALLATEVALLAVATRGGWLRHKASALVSAASSTGAVRRQRAHVRALRRVDDGVIVSRFETSLGPEFGERVAALAAPALAAYARLVGLPASGAEPTASPRGAGPAPE